METKVSKEELVEYLSTHSRFDTAKYFQLGHSNFIAHLKYFNIEKMGVRRKYPIRKIPPAKKELIVYLRNHSKEECKKHFGIGDWVLNRCLDAYGIKKLLPTTDIKRPARKALREYMRVHTNEEASKHFGVCKNTVENWRASHKIAQRPVNTVTFTEAAEILKVSKMTISVWNKKEMISGVIVNGYRSFIPMEELKRLMAQPPSCHRRT